MTSAGRWITAARRLLDHIEDTQMSAIEDASRMAADTIASGGLVHLFGSGHSRIGGGGERSRMFRPELIVKRLTRTYHTADSELYLVREKARGVRHDQLCKGPGNTRAQVHQTK